MAESQERGDKISFSQEGVPQPKQGFQDGILQMDKQEKWTELKEGQGLPLAVRDGRGKKQPSFCGSQWQWQHGESRKACKAHLNLLICGPPAGAKERKLIWGDL